MANGVNAPTGLLPVRTLLSHAFTGASGIICSIASGYASNIIKGDPVTASGTASASGRPGIVIGTDTTAYLGVFGGIISYFPTNNNYLNWSEVWVSNTVLEANTECLCVVYTDPNLVYQVQVGGGTNRLLATDVMNNAQLAGFAGGSVANATSGVYLNQATIAGTDTHGVKILGLYSMPNTVNSFDVDYNVAEVSINRSVFKAGTAGI